MSVAAGLLAAVLAAPLATPAPAPLDAASRRLAEGFTKSLVDQLCTLPAELMQAGARARVERPDLTEAELAGFDARVAASAPALRVACDQRVREVAGEPAGPATYYAARLRAALEASLAPREYAELRAFLDSPAGRHAEDARRAVDGDTYPRVALWARQFAPMLNDELGMMLRADIGALPPKAATAGAPAASPLARARIRNVSALGAGCESFYPVTARRDGEQGSVVLLVRIGAGGRLEGVLVETSSGHPSLDVAAAACVGALAEFEPPQRDGEPVAAWQRLRWTWRLGE
jgi:TonB family protein